LFPWFVVPLKLIVGTTLAVLVIFAISQIQNHLHAFDVFLGTFFLPIMTNSSESITCVFLFFYSELIV